MFVSSVGFFQVRDAGLATTGAVPSDAGMDVQDTGAQNTTRSVGTIETLVREFLTIRVNPRDTIPDVIMVANNEAQIRNLIVRNLPENIRQHVAVSDIQALPTEAITRIFTRLRGQFHGARFEQRIRNLNIPNPIVVIVSQEILDALHGMPREGLMRVGGGYLEGTNICLVSRNSGIMEIGTQQINNQELFDRTVGHEVNHYFLARLRNNDRVIINLSRGPRRRMQATSVPISIQATEGENEWRTFGVLGGRICQTAAAGVNLNTTCLYTENVFGWMIIEQVLLARNIRPERVDEMMSLATWTHDYRDIQSQVDSQLGRGTFQSFIENENARSAMENLLGRALGHRATNAVIQANSRQPNFRLLVDVLGITLTTARLTEQSHFSFNGGVVAINDGVYRFSARAARYPGFGITYNVPIGANHTLFFDIRGLLEGSSRLVVQLYRPGDNSSTPTASFGPIPNVITGDWTATRLQLPTTIRDLWKVQFFLDSDPGTVDVEIRNLRME